MEDALGMNLLRREQREAAAIRRPTRRVEIEPQHSAEDAARTRSRAVGLFNAIVHDILQQIEIGLHERWGSKARGSRVVRG